jgi:hypothetical protein
MALTSQGKVGFSAESIFACSFQAICWTSSGARLGCAPTASWASGVPIDSAAGSQQFAIHIEARGEAQLTGDFSDLPDGWCLGSQQFRQELCSR